MQYQLKFFWAWLLFLFTCAHASSQGKRLPEWTDPDYRIARFPDSRFLKSFYSEQGIKTPTNETYNTAIAAVKKELVESISTSLKTVTEFNLELINGKTDQRYLSSSKSVAEAELQGLKTEYHYDKKKKTVYAFAYADIRDVIQHNENILRNCRIEIDTRLRQNQTITDRKQRLLNYYEAIDQSLRWKKAFTLLVSLSPRTNYDEEKSTLLKALADIRTGIVAELAPKDLTPEEASLVAVQHLKAQSPDTKGEVLLLPITFEDNDLQSAFSTLIKGRLQEALITFTDLQPSENEGSPYQLSGSFLEQGSTLQLSLSLTEAAGRLVLAGSVAYLSIDALVAREIDYLPSLIDEIRWIESLSFQADQTTFVQPFKQEFVTPLKAQLVADNPRYANREVPVRFLLKHNKRRLCDLYKKPGIPLECMPDLSAIEESRLQVIAEVDWQEIISLPISDRNYYPYTSNIKAPSVTFDIRIEKPSVYLSVSGIEPDHQALIKSQLSASLISENFSIAPTKAEADWMISMEAKARDGSRSNGMYLAYNDNNYAFIHNHDNRELYRNALANLKGAGHSLTAARQRAAEHAAGSSSKEILKRIYRDL